MTIKDAPQGSLEHPEDEPLSASSKDESRLKRKLEPSIWTDDLPDSDHVRFFKRTDWSSTPCGPLDGWGLALKLYTHTVLSDSRPACVYWGPDRIAIYNEAFAPLADRAHPKLMGSPFRLGFPEIADAVNTIFTAGEETKKAIDVHKLELIVERSGSAEETYFTGNFNPLRDDNGKVAGFYNATYEMTSQVLQDRRTAMFNLIAADTEGLNSLQIWDHIVAAMKTNERDVPMALMYQVDEETTRGECALHLRGRIGVPPGHYLAVEQTVIESPDGIIPLLREARTSTVVTASVDDAFQGVTWLGFGVPSKSFCVASISSGQRLYGFVVLGMNPRRPVDATSLQFVRDLTRQLSVTLSSVASMDESRKRELRLHEELAESERQIRYLAQHASVGMQQVKLDGTMLWANEEYYKITNHPRGTTGNAKFSFFAQILDEDLPKAHEGWDLLTKGEPHISVELRIKREFTPPTGEPEPATMLALAFPYFQAGKVTSIMACIIDVSSLKWAESLQAKNAATAREQRRQQEQFIDIVSHEMRNPLSAIHCAEGIITSIQQHGQDPPTMNSSLDILHSNVHAAKQILICAQHQKRIIDDVLTLSRLESRMLSMNTIATQPTQLIDHVISMFQAEILSHKIRIEIMAEASVSDLDISWIMCDAKRATQIIVNLVTNAIKFTKDETKREITVRYGVKQGNPQQAFSKDMHWARSSGKLPGDGHHNESDEKLFFTFSITDSGIGMTGKEMRRLFDRFAQANARTSVKYGGSGLGLFISRQLAEAHGGDLGVASDFGQGSTFGFYLCVDRTGPPSDTFDTNSHIDASIHTVVHGERHADLNVASRKINVLLVEDNAINAQVLEKQLTKHGCVVALAENGVECLEYLKCSNLWHESKMDSKRVDIILMDVEMPVMDGLVCSREIRSMQKSGLLRRHVDIIAITANARLEQIELALGAGVDSVLPKPFMVADLIKKMRKRVKEQVSEE